MDIVKLIGKLPKNTKDKVEDAKKSHNKLIREAIRFETRLSLNSGQTMAFEDNFTANSKVAIKVTMGYPDELRDFHIPEQHRLAVELSQIRPALIQLIGSASKVSDFISDNKYIDEVGEFVGAAICHSESEAIKLLELADTYDFVKEILSINKDILGCYRYSIGHSYAHSFNSEAGDIFLYWGVIGLVASRIGVEIEALSAVVLAHELAHAYTHLGYDIDGGRWDNNGFEYSDTIVIEGLAQYYTERVIGKLRYKIPGAWEAYEKLLEKQSRDYQQHKLWINALQATPESVRRTLIQIRSGEPVSYSDFERLLEQNNLKKR